MARRSQKKHYKDGNTKHGLWTEWFRNRQKKVEAHYKDGKQDGRVTEWYMNGQKKSEKHYKDGNNDGKWITWHENGHKKVEKIFQDGKLIAQTDWDEAGNKTEGIVADGVRQGLWTTVDKSGKIIVQVEYSHQGKAVSATNGAVKRFEKHALTGLRHGHQAQWDEQGKPIESLHFHLGVKSGSQEKWYPNGQKQSEEYYTVTDGDGDSKNGKPDGFWVEWYANGNKKSQGRYQDGLKIDLWTTWHENGKKYAEGNYLRTNERAGSSFENPYISVKDGMWTEWHGNGQKAQAGHYQKGRRIGLWTTWHQNGTKNTEGNYYIDEDMTYRDDYQSVKDGLWTAWHESGKKRLEGHYQQGVKTGDWTLWYEEGPKFSEGRFVNNERTGVWRFWHENGQKRSKIRFTPARQIDATTEPLNFWDAEGSPLKLDTKERVRVEYTDQHLERILGAGLFTELNFGSADNPFDDLFDE